ncbi:MAG: DoxX family protein [Chitinophagaceae bacterium]
MKKFLFGSSIGDNKWVNIVWLLFRFNIGLSMAIHAGLPKITAGLIAPDWFIKQVGEIGFTFPSPVFWASIASWGEFLGGLLIAVGLFTRVAAIQLAFQFFVVSFIWYKEPMPVVGMYYQQLIFWGYALIAVAGGGTISIDNWILNRKKMMPPSIVRAAATLSMILLMSTSLIAQTPPIIQANELINLQGNWIGTLTYLDYGSGKETVIACNIFGHPKKTSKKNNTWVLDFSYPKEKGQEHVDEYRINKDGKTINKLKLLEKSLLPDGTLKIVLEEKGKDGNDQKPATFQRILLIGAQKLSIIKMVRFDDSKEFFKRHEFSFSR